MSSRLGMLLPAAMLIASAAAPAVSAEKLGRLFFTPQQREDLDRRRQANAQESAVTVNSLVTVNGQVSRSGGKTTVWINGVPHVSTGRPRDPTRVRVPGTEGEPTVSLKIGQTLDKVRGEVKDPLGAGSVSADPAKRERRP